MKVNINLNEINKVKEFVNISSKKEFNIFIKSNRYIIDAKSIMGIFSLDLCKPLELYAEDCTVKQFDEYCKEIEKFILEQSV